MIGQSPDQHQRDLYHPLLTDFINLNHHLVRLAEHIPWKRMEQKFAGLYSSTGQPAKPIRLMVGLLLLKRIYNLGDETVMEAWVSNPYYQYFCGEAYFQWKPPCDPSDLVHFRKRIGPEGAEFLLTLSVEVHKCKAREVEEVLVDTTAQEKNITYPTDAKLCQRAAEHLWKIAAEEQLTLRQSYRRTMKALRRQAWFGHHPRRAKKARKAIAKMKTRLGRLVRDVRRKLPPDRLQVHQPMLDLCNRVATQQRFDPNKIYSIHEPGVACIAKGKSHKKYEFGSKVSIAVSAKTGLVLGVVSFSGNPHDRDTLEPTLDHVRTVVGRVPKTAVVDRGYRGIRAVGATRVIVPNQDKPQTEWEKRKLRRICRRRAAIEPIIGHIKSDCRMQRNYLSGLVGDQMNALLAATGFNLRKRLRELAEHLRLLVFASVFPVVSFKGKAGIPKIQPILSS